MLYPTPEEIDFESSKLDGGALKPADQSAVRGILAQLFMRKDFDATDYPDATAKLAAVRDYDAQVILAAKRKLVALRSSMFDLNLTGVGKVNDDTERLEWAKVILATLYPAPSREVDAAEVAVGALLDPTCGACRYCGYYPCHCPGFRMIL